MVTPGLYEDALSHDAELLTLLSRHFPEQQLPQTLLAELGRRISANQYHSLSASLLMRAFAAYERAPRHADNGLSAELGLGDNDLQPLPLHPETPLPLDWDKVVLRQEKAGTAAFYQLSEAGFDRIPSNEQLTQGVEITRELVNDKGELRDRLELGQEYTVRLRMRATERDRIDEIAMVDLLPGGLEPIPFIPTDETDEGAAEQESGREPVGATAWEPSFVNMRDDRVIVYGTLSRDVATYEYRVRAINEGTFTLPAPYAEGMYDRRLQGRGKAGSLTILSP